MGIPGLLELIFYTMIYFLPTIAAVTVNRFSNRYDTDSLDIGVVNLAIGWVLCWVWVLQRED